MQAGWIFGLLTLWVLLVNGLTYAQTKADIEKPAELMVQPNTLAGSRPKSLTFTASTDQRFFFFNDTRTEDNSRKPVSVYGVRAGFLFPAKHRREALEGGRRASFKAGAGFYFVNQQLDVPGLLPNTNESITRHLRIATVFYERFLLRRKAFEVSLPIEFGYGHSRYERTSDEKEKQELARGVFLPLGVGVSASYQFPAIRWLKPLHWFGLNVLTGYRFTLKKDVPESQINYSGLYVSVGPIVLPRKPHCRFQRLAEETEEEMRRK